MVKNLVFKLKGNEYNLKFPNVGEFKRIQALKEVLSSGMYSAMSKSVDNEVNYATDMIHIEATLKVLEPKIFKDLKCSDFDDLAIEDYIELRKNYIEQVTPWWNECLKTLSLIKE